MTNQTATTTAVILSTAGILFILAMAFGILPGNMAIFAGVACFILAGMMRKFGGEQKKD